MSRGGEMSFEALPVMAGPFEITVTGFAQISEDGMYGCMADAIRVTDMCDDEGEEIPLGGFVEKLVAELAKETLNSNPDKLDAWFQENIANEDD